MLTRRRFVRNTAACATLTRATFRAFRYWPETRPPALLTGEPPWPVVSL
jgi:hypothetical protein